MSLSHWYRMFAEIYCNCMTECNIVVAVASLAFRFRISGGLFSFRCMLMP